MGLAVSATDLGLLTTRGWVYRDVALDVPPACLAAVTGPAGSGRSSLLLTMAGRMRPTSGTARVGPHRLPADMRRVGRLVGLGLFAGVNDLDDTLSVGDLVHEQLALRGHVRRSERVAPALARAGLELDPAQPCRDLGPGERVLLGVALGLVTRPEVLVVDDVDAGLDPEAGRLVWEALRQVARSGVTVLVSCLAEPPGAQADVAVRLADPRPLTDSLQKETLGARR